MPQSDWYSDTDPRALAVFIECQRRMTASEKLQAVLGWNRMLFEMVRAEIRRLHPLADEREIFLRTAARRFDRETMIRVYGWDPESAAS
jgi:hypothetical protein